MLGIDVLDCLNTIPTTMERPERRPETPHQANALKFTGTMFGAYWVNGDPLEAVIDTDCEGYASGETHYKLVPVPFKIVTLVFEEQPAN
jgi:hypothetical protein